MRAALVLVCASLLTLPLVASEEEPYTATSFCAWDQAEFDVLILPPAGPYAVYDRGEDVDAPSLLVLDPATQPAWDGAHARAAAAAVDEWERALHALAADGRPHLSGIDLRWTIAGPALDRAIAESADIIVEFTPAQDAAGRAVVSCRGAASPPVIQEDGTTRIAPPGSHILLNQWFVLSFTPNDTYNVMLHEFAHILGLEHIERPRGDIMNPVYAHKVGNIENPRECLSNLDVLQMAAAFQWMDGTTRFQSPPPSTVMPTERYARDC